MNLSDLKKLIRASVNPMLLVTPDFKVVAANIPFTKLSKLPLATALKRNLKSFFVQPQKVLKKIEPTFTSGFLFNCPLLLDQKSGKPISVLVSAFFREKQKGKDYAIVSVMPDPRAIKKDSLLSISTDMVSPNSHSKRLGKGSSDKNLRQLNQGLYRRLKNIHLVNSQRTTRGKEAHPHQPPLSPSFLGAGTSTPNKTKRSSGETTAPSASNLLETAALYSRGIMEVSNDPLFTIDLKGGIQHSNEAMVRVTGLTHAELKDSDFKTYFTEPTKVSHLSRKLFKHGSIVNSPLTLNNTTHMQVLFNGRVYKNAEGTTLGAVISTKDLSEQNRTENELLEAISSARQATQLAEQARVEAETASKTAKDSVKSKQQFLSNMSHEIRTPMNAILGFTKVLLKSDLNFKQREYLTAIKMSGDSLIVLINDILDLAKVDAGKMTFEKTPFRLEISTSAMLHLFEPKMQEKNLKLIKDYDTNIPPILLGDSVKLHQIILNLVSNAIKFTNSGTITVCVKLLAEDKDSVRILFSVEDTGIGIEKNKIKQIFENFQQASGSTSRLYGGTGLGLAIVKQLVERQGGKVKVVSKPGRGSTFSFTMNFAKTDIELLPVDEMIQHDQDLKNVRVLVVEDIALNQLLMKTVLDDFGFESDLAANGELALEKLQKNQYDVILMDLQMPVMNGFEATQHIRTTLNLTLPIIALTADVTSVDLATCKSVGMDDYIAKPVDEKTLYTKIVGLIKSRALKKEKEQIEAMLLRSDQRCTNLQNLSHRTKSNPDLMMEMISLYLEQTPALVKSMKESLYNKDWKSLNDAIHKMIPSFSIVGIHPEFEDIAKKIQEYASTQEETDKVEDMIMTIESVCLQACSELQEEFNILKRSPK